MVKERWRPVLIGGGWAMATAFLGASLTTIGPWYRGLDRPWFQPPDWAFGPAWTLIFALAAWGFVRAWRAGARGALVAAFAVNGLLNALWSLLFFTLERPDLALIEIVPLWLSILAMILLAARHDRAAAWLIVPYIAWVSFAGFLNLAIVRLNGPFG
ncbi:MAG: tryptophan-rich sensory protein [Rubritepida sp.]|jgi:tryptophan-rich sensory protein|nr:tryptophan-rich sensory protein [Rubritepida sp.]